MWRKSWQFDKIKCKSWNVKISLQMFEFYVKENGTLLQATRENTHPDLTWPSVVVFSVVVCNLHQNLPRNLCLWRTLCWRVQSYSPSQIDWVFHQPLSFELLNFLPSGSTYVKCSWFPDSRDKIFHPASSSSPVFRRILEALPEPRSSWRLLDQSFWSPLAINRYNSFSDK